MIEMRELREIVKKYDQYEEDMLKVKNISQELESLCAEFAQECYDLINNINTNDLENIIQEGKVVKKYIRKVLNRTEDTRLFYLGMFSGIHNTTEYLSVKQVDLNEFKTHMDYVLSKKYRKQILKYLFYNDVATPENLREEFGIRNKSQITKIMNELADIKCVYRRELGKYVRYELTEMAIKYVREYIKTNECIIDLDGELINHVEKWETIGRRDKEFGVSNYISFVEKSYVNGMSKELFSDFINIEIKQEEDKINYYRYKSDIESQLKNYNIWEVVEEL